MDSLPEIALAPVGTLLLVLGRNQAHPAAACALNLGHFPAILGHFPPPRLRAW